MNTAFDTIDENSLRVLVNTFYDDVRRDALLGPIFELRIGASWQRHMGRMVDFWSSVLLGTGRFRGNPMLKHALIPDLSARHFDRWMELFELTTRRLFMPEAAELILLRARNMRRGLERYAVAKPVLQVVG